jgi:A/G-specific adenine glycosylase
MSERVAPALTAWHEKCGRHDLPWQIDRTPYRVWVSEIMLQQTQVTVVIPYYERFMQRFADIRTLADAPVDDVLNLWAGLGYYARGRNLHRAAQRIRDEFAGMFPTTFEDVAGLPGIGRSTAGAILALSCDQRFPILDGNARRVLARYFGVEGSASDSAVSRRLWELADASTPAAEVSVYTQAIMDLGATLCVRRRPSCCACPLENGCVARRTGRQHEIPSVRSARVRGTKHTYMLAAVRPDGAVRLEKRPDAGIWGGLWCLPEFADVNAAQLFAHSALGGVAGGASALGNITHGFTHFELSITPLVVRCHGDARVCEGPAALWYHPKMPQSVGLPAPVRALVEKMANINWSG